MGQDNNIDVRSLLEWFHIGWLDSQLPLLVGNKVDLLLLLRHCWNILINRQNIWSTFSFGVEPQQTQECVSVVLVRGNTLLQEVAEVFDPLVVLFWVSLRFIIDHFQGSTGQDIPKFADQAGVLVVLTRNVQWEVFTVDNTFHKTQILREQFSAMFFD